MTPYMPLSPDPLSQQGVTTVQVVDGGAQYLAWVETRAVKTLTAREIYVSAVQGPGNPALCLLTPSPAARERIANRLSSL